MYTGTRTHTLSSEWPPVIMDASKTYSADKFQAQLDEATLKVKSSYWYEFKYKIMLQEYLADILTG